MINMCCHCGHMIQDGEQVEMVVEGPYSSIPSVNSFRIGKNMIFRTGTLGHVECPDE